MRDLRCVRQDLSLQCTDFLVAAQVPEYMGFSRCHTWSSVPSQHVGP